jgi:hypothetical protein
MGMVRNMMVANTKTIGPVNLSAPPDLNRAQIVRLAAGQLSR